jgi:hypothetical protein
LRDEVLNYSFEILKPLFGFYAARDEEKHETPRVYIGQGADLQLISEVIFTDYDTIISPINCIRDVFKIELKDPETAFTAQLAIRIRDLLL